MKIYTRTGDDGFTSLPGGHRVPKNDPRIALCGELDELNSHLGAAHAHGPHPQVDAVLTNLQNQIFEAGAAIAAQKPYSVSPQTLEHEIDRIQATLPELRHFILPGGSPAAAHIHIARAICRRAERTATSFLPPDDPTLPWLNRLSDILFVLARQENLLSGHEEQKWTSATQ